MEKTKSSLMKRIGTAIVIFMFAMLCSQVICYFFFDNLMRHFTTSIYTTIFIRLIFTFLIYIFLMILLTQKRLDRYRKIVILLLYISFTLVLTLKPVPFRLYNIKPFQFLNDLQVNIQQVILLAGNIIIYIPIGFMVCDLLRMKKARKTFLFSIILLTIMEGIQYFLTLGVFDIDDILLNFTGFLIGYYFFIMCKYIRSNIS